MEQEVKRLLDTFDAMRNEASVNACFGEPVTVEGKTVIPVAKIGYGFGVGTGHAASWEDSGAGVREKSLPAGGGVGGGMTSSPVGFIEVSEGETRIEPILDQQKLVIAGLLAGAWSVFWLSRALAAIFGSSD